MDQNLGQGSSPGIDRTDKDQGWGSGIQDTQLKMQIRKFGSWLRRETNFHKVVHFSANHEEAAQTRGFDRRGLKCKTCCVHIELLC